MINWNTHTHTQMRPNHPHIRSARRYINSLSHSYTLSFVLFFSTLDLSLVIFFPRHSYFIRLSPCNSECFVDLFKQIFSILSHRNVFVLWVFVFHRFTVYSVLSRVSVFFPFIAFCPYVYFFNHILVVGNKTKIISTHKVHCDGKKKKKKKKK